jgi:hypothetical protein
MGEGLPDDWGLSRRWLVIQNRAESQKLRWRCANTPAGAGGTGRVADQKLHIQDTAARKNALRCADMGRSVLRPYTEFCEARLSRSGGLP